VEVSLEPTTVDNSPRGVDVTRAAVNVIDAVDIRSSLVGVARRGGVTSAVSMPSGGLIEGRSAWIDLVGPRSRFLERAARGPLAMHVALDENGAKAVGGSRTTMMLHFRRVLEDARIFKTQKVAFMKNALYPLSASRLDLAALDDVLTQKIRLVVEASRASDIVSVIEMAKRERIRIAILGAEEGWLVADVLAQARVPVILTPFENLPQRFETLNNRGDNATLLAKAGVRVAIATRSSHNAADLRFALGVAVRAGLPQGLALRAATIVPAEIFGMERQYGSLEAGKIANVVVWTGDPFEPSSWAEDVIIRGELQPTENRQTRLSQRYIEKYKLLAPTSGKAALGAGWTR
jgi:imidazolonepropionase-like amidohydrolase